MKPELIELRCSARVLFIITIRHVQDLAFIGVQNFPKLKTTDHFSFRENSIVTWEDWLLNYSASHKKPESTRENLLLAKHVNENIWLTSHANYLHGTIPWPAAPILNCLLVIYTAQNCYPNCWANQLFWNYSLWDSSFALNFWPKSQIHRLPSCTWSGGHELHILHSRGHSWLVCRWNSIAPFWGQRCSSQIHWRNDKGISCFTI